MAIAVVIACVFMAIPATATDTTYPILDNQVAIRQAHIAWQAAIYEAKMLATVDYFASLNGDTTKLSSILSQFQDKAGQAGSISTHVGLNNLLRDMTDLVRQFREETRTQMAASKGRPVELMAKMNDAVKSDPQIASLESTYWSTRETNRLADFDTRVSRAQTILDTLKGKGYDTAGPQATLGQISAKRSDLESALASRDNTRIQSVDQSIADLWQTLAQQVRDLQVSVSDDQKVKFWLDAGRRIMGRVDMIDRDLKSLGVDTSTLDPLVTTAKSDLAAAQDSYDSGDITTAKVDLQTFRLDLKNLRDAYRALVAGGKVTGTAADQVQSLANTLDSTTNQIGEIS
jgi:hypothetical protein